MLLALNWKTSSVIAKWLLVIANQSRLKISVKAINEVEYIQMLKYLHHQ